MKYYFITYQAKSRRSSIHEHPSLWNQVIKGSPMKFIKQVSEVEENGSRSYYNFVIINTCEISEEEYIEYNGHF